MSNPDEVICPKCVHQFRAVPVNVQERIAELEAALDVALEALEKYCTPYKDGTHPADDAIAKLKEVRREHA